MNITILGAGAWGTALAISLSAKHRVSLWARDPAQAADIRSSRRNSRYLPEASVPEGIRIIDDPAPAFEKSETILIATPTSALRNALERLKASGSVCPVIWACKGFEHPSGVLPHQIVAEVLGNQTKCAALSGPSFALEVAQGRPTALTLASLDAEFARSMARDLHHPTLRIYFSTDLIGVEIGGAVKNVMAIATGICDGLGLGLNARAALITRGLAELTRLGVALGGRLETFIGLAGAGDLILTCTGDLSRNRRVGLLLSRGEPIERILERLGHVAEGVHSVRAIEKLAAEKRVDMPITQAVCAVLFRGTSPRDAVHLLLARDPKGEI